jgi:hypothetical protein
VDYGPVSIQLTNAEGFNYQGNALLTVKAQSDGAICPTVEDVYALAPDGKHRLPVTTSDDSCQTLNKGEEGEVLFVTVAHYVAGGWPPGSQLVFAPGDGPVVARWHL